MTLYALPADDLHVVLKEVIDEYHPHLRDAEVKVDVLLAYATRDANGDPNGAALKKDGYPCYGIARVLGIKDRVAGRGDAEICLDGDQIETWSDDQLKAILDHELTHLELKVSDKGLVRRDDFDRPLLRIRQHDRQFGWFDCVAKRHGSNSIEIQQAQQLTAMPELQQLYLPGMPETPAKRKR